MVDRDASGEATRSRPEALAMIAEVKGARLLAGLSRTAGGGPRGARGYPGARVLPRHAHRRTLGRVGHRPADGAAVGSGSEGGRRARRL